MKRSLMLVLIGVAVSAFAMSFVGVSRASAAWHGSSGSYGTQSYAKNYQTSQGYGNYGNNHVSNMNCGCEEEQPSCECKQVQPKCTCKEVKPCCVERKECVRPEHVRVEKQRCMPERCEIVRPCVVRTPHMRCEKVRPERCECEEKCQPVQQHECNQCGQPQTSCDHNQACDTCGSVGQYAW